MNVFSLASIGEIRLMNRLEKTAFTVVMKLYFFNYTHPETLNGFLGAEYI